MGRRNTLNYVLDGTIGLAFLLAALTGLVFLLPEAAGDGSRTVLGLSRGGWSDLHTWVGLMLAAGMVVHLALHWRWIVCMTCRRVSRVAGPARLNYALDLVMALAGLAALVAGVVFLLGRQDGFQGGRNPAFQQELLGLGRWAWRDLHTWAGLVLMAGVLVHLGLHAEWIVRTTRRLLRGERAAVHRAEVWPGEAAVCESEV